MSDMQSGVSPPTMRVTVPDLPAAREPGRRDPDDPPACRRAPRDGRTPRPDLPSRGYQTPMHLPS